jgi:hypothetical protein
LEFKWSGTRTQLEIPRLPEWNHPFSNASAFAFGFFRYPFMTPFPRMTITPIVVPSAGTGAIVFGSTTSRPSRRRTGCPAAHGGGRARLSGCPTPASRRTPWTVHTRLRQAVGVGDADAELRHCRQDGGWWSSASSHDVDDTRQRENGVCRRGVDDGVQHDWSPTQVSHTLVGYS